MGLFQRGWVMAVGFKLGFKLWVFWAWALGLIMVIFGLRFEKWV